MKYTNLAKSSDKYSVSPDLLSLNSNNIHKNNSKTMTKNSSTHTVTVNKSYEFSNDMIHESCFYSSCCDDIPDFFDAYVEQFSKGVILIVNDVKTEKERNIIDKVLKPKAKNTIFLSNKDGELYGSISKGGAKISNNIEQATKSAYSMATNGQAILICGVNPNFDFCSCVF